MFELFNAYELAKNEKNKLFRFLCMTYVRHELKSKFFTRYKKSILNNNIIVNPDLINEFMQFYNCTYEGVTINTKTPHVVSINNNKINIYFEKYNIYVYQLPGSDDEVAIDYHFGNDERMFSLDINYKEMSKYFYHDYYRYNKMILSSIYNYCVSYIYGNNTNLFLDTHKGSWWIE